VAHPSAGNQNFPRRKQTGCQPYTRHGHLTGGFEFARGRIEQLGGAVEILVASHAARDEDLAVRQQGCSVSRTRLEHRRRKDH